VLISGPELSHLGPGLEKGRDVLGMGSHSGTVGDRPALDYAANERGRAV